MSLPWASLVVDNPRFEQFIFGGSEVSGTEWIEASVSAGAEQFRLPEKQLAQLWWYSFSNSVIAPAVHLMVGYEAIPSLDFSSGRLACEGFWCGFRTEESVESVAAAGGQLATSVTPLIDALVAAFSLRPAPLWALTADALRQSALEAGNVNFDPVGGAQVARKLVAGLGRGTEVELSAVVDGAVVDFDPGLGDDCFVFAPRTSCCMVYRSPGSGLCTSCPKRPDAWRIADMIALADSAF